MVKSRTQVVAGISNEHRKLCRDVFKLLKPEYAFFFYNIVTDSVGLTLQKPLHQLINDLEVFICSAEFEKRAIQRVHNLNPITEVMIEAMLNISYSRAKRLEGKVDGKKRREIGESRICKVKWREGEVWRSWSVGL